MTVYTLEQYYSEKPLAYVYDLAVSVEYQRKGIARQLMAAVVGHCQAAGYEEVFVQAEKVDQYALDFYRSTPITGEEKVRHFTYNF
ncbi:MAG: GNAT family N-acetyltransferase [Candidatus Paceibacterota bacterium]